MGRPAFPSIDEEGRNRSTIASWKLDLPDPFAPMRILNGRKASLSMDLLLLKPLIVIHSNPFGGMTVSRRACAAAPPIGSAGDRQHIVFGFFPSRLMIGA